MIRKANWIAGTILLLVAILSGLTLEFAARATSCRQSVVLQAATPSGQLSTGAQRNAKSICRKAPKNDCSIG